VFPSCTDGEGAAPSKRLCGGMFCESLLRAKNILSGGASSVAHCFGEVEGCLGNRCMSKVPMWLLLALCGCYRNMMVDFPDCFWPFVPRGTVGVFFVRLPHLGGSVSVFLV
jgi:hypothetical protein